MDLSNKDGLDKFTVDENPVILEGIENIREVLDMGKQRCVIYEDWLCSFIKGQPFFEQHVVWGLRKLEARIQQTLDGSREVIFPMVNGTVYVEVIVVSQYNLKTIRDWDTKLMTSLVTSIAEARYPLTTVKKRRKQLGDIVHVPFIKKDEMACPAKCLVCKGVTIKPYIYSNNIPGRYEIKEPSDELWIRDDVLLMVGLIIFIFFTVNSRESVRSFLHIMENPRLLSLKNHVMWMVAGR